MKLYVYDHCPYCVKARMIFGLKRIPFEMAVLLNDDVATPTRLIGQKMVPILETGAGAAMPESMDIVRHVDAQYGTPVLTPAHNPDILQWLSASRDYMSALCLWRWVEAPLEEFATEGARAYFIHKKEAAIGSFAVLRERSDALIAQANAHVVALAPLIRSAEAVNGTLSEDDIHLFASLRSLSIVRGIQYPPAVEAYRQHMAQRSAVPLHDAIAL